MSPLREWDPEGPRPTFSFYLTPHMVKRDPGIIATADSLCGAITLVGIRGPRLARQLRIGGLTSSFLFDGFGYGTERAPDPATWAETQRGGDARQVLLPGVFVPWDKDSNRDAEAIIRAQARIAVDLDASLLLAVDSRWIGKRCEFLRDELLLAERPACLVLAHRADPLAIGGAAAGLRWIASRVPELTVLRSDHGAVGALAAGAVHASFGLTTTTRHFAPPHFRPTRRPDNSHRVFVLSLLDWFLASDIASWVAAGARFHCSLPCCETSLARFLDPDEKPDLHNMHAVADFADLICNAPDVHRGQVFREQYEAAVQHYGLSGFRGPETPRAQLAAWALS